MSGQFQVLVGDLRATATKYAGVESELGTSVPTLGATSSEALGDGDLASWVRAVVDQVKSAHDALHTEAGDMVTTLNDQAERYEASDTGASTSLTQITPLFSQLPSVTPMCVAPNPLEPNPASLFPRLGAQ